MTQLRRTFIICIFSLLFLSINGTGWAQSEELGETEELAVNGEYASLPTQSLGIMLDGPDTRMHHTAISQKRSRTANLIVSTSTERSALIHLGQSDVEASESKHLAFFSDSKLFHVSDQGFSLDSGMFQPSEQYLYLDTEMLQTSVQDLFSDSLIFLTNNGDLLSNADSLQTSDEGFRSSTEMFRLGKEYFLSDTEQFQTRAQALPVSVLYDDSQKTSHQNYQSTRTLSDHNDILVIPTPPENTEMTVMCCNSETISSSQTQGSAAYVTTVESIMLNNRGEIGNLRTAKRLNVVQLQKHAGFITTPGFNGIDNYPSNVNDTYCFSMNQSDSQTLVLSFPYFSLEDSNNCRYDYLELSVENLDNGTNLWRKCGSQTMPAEIRNESVICLRFSSDSLNQEKGFNVTYSFLPGSVSDYKLDNGFFNCSTIDSYHRSLHFDCNLALECDGRQDEINCSYSSKECPGLIDMGDKCYTNKLMSNVSWSAANIECLNLKQILVSPQEVKELDTLIDILGSVRRSVAVYFGLQTTGYSSTIPPLYRHAWQWSTHTTAFHVNLKKKQKIQRSQPACARFVPYISNNALWIESCFMGYDVMVMCQSPKKIHQSPGFPQVSLKTSSYMFSNATIQCSAGHFVKNYLECDLESQCHVDLSQEECLRHSTEPTPELFSCLVSTTNSVHYTLLCDFRFDCPDASDESFCVHKECPEDTCGNGQCIDYGQRCDSVLHCLDGSDENCPKSVRLQTKYFTSQVIVHLDKKGLFTVQSLNDSDSCPDTHFRCQNTYCLPVYLRCNDVNDCPDHEDELSSECDKSTCPGFLRCRGSNVCVHPNHTCDGIPHCPQQDDEMLCNITCPQHCSCQGLAFVCSSAFSFHSYPNLRYLHIESSSMSAVDLSSNSYLVLLRLSDCHLKSLHLIRLDGLPNIQTLDLRDNFLTSVQLSTFDNLDNLRSLVLSRNPLTHIIPSLQIYDNLKILDLSHTLLHTVSDTTLRPFPRIQTLDLSNSALNNISDDGFNSTSELQYLDLSGNSLKYYPIYMLRHLSQLKHVRADDFKLCCKSALPEGFDLKECYAPQDNVASCDDLLRSTTYKTFLWIVAVFALIGNAGSSIARFFLAREFLKSTFGLFVLNLSISDFLMGVYLTMIGVADQMFRGQYWWRADIWKQSAACKTAGFLSLLSSEVSAFFISLITIDRFLVLRFPFSRFHFGSTSALVACVLSWTVGIVLAGVPLLPLTSHWDFYGQTGICLPLPFTKKGKLSGYVYSFSVMIILNFVLFMFIALGQALIYCSVWTAHKSQIRKNVKSSDAAVARRLIAIVLTDFLCWFPTGILGLLAFAGNDIPSDINITVAVFVMPFNAALNPFLYTLNLVMEKRRKATEARLMLRLQASLKADVTRLNAEPKRQTQGMLIHQTDSKQQVLPLELMSRSHPKEAALNQIDKWLKEGLLSPSEIASCFDSA